MRLRLIICLTILFCFAGNASAEWYQHEGKGYVLCDAMKKRFNSYKWKGTQEISDADCTWNVVASYPEFKEPQWQDMNPKQHERLIIELIKYRTCGANGYFQRINPIDGKARCRSNVMPEVLSSEVEDFMTGRKKIQLMRARVLTNKDFTDGIAPTWLQTVVQFRMLRSVAHMQQIANRCPGKPSVNWTTAGLSIVMDDLSAPHDRVTSDGTFAGVAFFVYAGKLHYVRSVYDIDIGVIEEDGYSHYFCKLRYRDFKRRSQ